MSSNEEKEREPKEEEEEEAICRLSHPAHPHTLSRQTNKENLRFPHGVSNIEEFRSIGFYYCPTCDVEFDRIFYIWPRKMTHPYHPQHPLTLSTISSKTGIIYDADHVRYFNDEEFTGEGIQDPGNIFKNCTWCGGNWNIFEHCFYRCSTCSFCLDLRCSSNFPLPSIQNPNIHHHSLIFVPRPLLVPCDACGLVEKSDPSYACFQCNFFVHKSCLDLPHVIKLTRHSHRLSYTPFHSPTLSLSCCLCYKMVDVKYGQYFCNQDDACSYVVHSKCATHKTIWDGRELEWEELAKTEDVEPFKKVGDGLIKYFCHDHHLKLEKYNGVRDAEKKCQACIFHIDSRDFYNCLQCDFFLHEVCANLPRKLDHALHNHPLILDTSARMEEHKTNGCSVCHRKFSGFRYKCYKTNCNDGDAFRGKEFNVDFGCILVPDCFTHNSHEHPLFIPIYSDPNEKIWCEGCKDDCFGFYLKCTLCDFTICYKCATTPDKLHYKYTDLPLSLCYGEDSLETYWCDVCERKLDPSQWFYTCNKSCITIHRDCVFGPYVYMMPDYMFYRGFSTVKVLSNGSNTRPICHGCEERCTSVVYFKISVETIICSSCFY